MQRALRLGRCGGMAVCSTPRTNSGVLSVSQRYVLPSPSSVPLLTQIDLAHQCNMKEFAVLVGTSLDNMSRVLHASLKNDSMSESFTVKHTNNAGLSFPTRYVKIIPLSGHNPHFNTSIWHVSPSSSHIFARSDSLKVSMTGISDEAYVQQVQRAYEEVC